VGNKRIAVIFFGQVKCYDRLYDNFLYRVGRHINDISDYFVITSRKSHYVNPRQNESSAIDYSSMFKYFDFTDVLYDGLEDEHSQKCYFIKDFCDRIIREYGGAWLKDSTLSTFNSIKQIYSLHLMMSHINRPGNLKYDRYVLIRSDIFFDTDFNLEMLDYNEDVVVPSFASWGGYNDRFAILNLAGFNSYCSRYEKLMRNPSYYHAEEYLKNVLDKDGMKVRTVDTIRFRLMRGDGSLTDINI
jgi:hypothetical protein